MTSLCLELSEAKQQLTAAVQQPGEARHRSELLSGMPAGERATLLVKQPAPARNSTDNRGVESLRCELSKTKGQLKEASEQLEEAASELEGARQALAQTEEELQQAKARAAQIAADLNEKIGRLKLENGAQALELRDAKQRVRQPIGAEEQSVVAALESQVTSLCLELSEAKQQVTAAVQQPGEPQKVGVTV